MAIDVSVSVRLDKEQMDAVRQEVAELNDAIQKANALADALAQRMKELKLEIEFVRVQDQVH